MHVRLNFRAAPRAHVPPHITIISVSRTRIVGDCRARNAVEILTNTTEKTNTLHSNSNRATGRQAKQTQETWCVVYSVREQFPGCAANKSAEKYDIYTTRIIFCALCALLSLSVCLSRSRVHGGQIRKVPVWGWRTISRANFMRMDSTLLLLLLLALSVMRSKLLGFVEAR